MLSVDLSNAFGSVSHNAIVEALRTSGAGDEFASIILSMYSGATTKIVSGSELSDPVTIHTGVKQGCPLSGLLFNLAVDPLIRSVASDNVNVLAYADDLLIV